MALDLSPSATAARAKERNHFHDPGPTADRARERLSKDMPKANVLAGDEAGGMEVVGKEVGLAKVEAGPPEDAFQAKAGVYGAKGDPYKYKLNDDGSVEVAFGPGGNVAVHIDAANPGKNKTALDAIMEQIRSGQLSKQDDEGPSDMKDDASEEGEPMSMMEDAGRIYDKLTTKKG